MISIVLVLGLLSTCLTAKAQDANAPTSDAVQRKQLEDQKALVDAQKDLLLSQKELLTAQKQLIEAKFPTIEGGIEGKLSQGTGHVHQLGVWSKVFERLDRSAKNLCAKLEAPTAGKNTVLLSDEDVKAASQYLIANNDLTDIERAMKSAAGESPPSAAFALPLATAAAALTTVADFTKLFRTNRTLFDETVDIPSEALADRIALCLTEDLRRPVQYPAVKFLQVVLTPANSKFWTRLNSLDRTHAKLTEITNGTDKVKAATAKTASDRFDKFIGMLVATNETAKTPNLLYLLRGETVNEAASQNNSALLLLSIPKQGGFSMTTSSIWHEDRLYVTGGVIISYRLIEGGQLKAAGTLSEVEPELERVPLSSRRAIHSVDVQPW